MRKRIETIFQKTVDQYHAMHPRQVPALKNLQQCKIISHRGEHDNKNIVENTIAAFDKALDAGVWGVEFDIRWTGDLVPVVFHDKSLKRLFKRNIKLSNVSFSSLRQQFPIIPSLEEVLQKYGGKLHMMIEIKKENYPQPLKQTAILKSLLENLTPIEHYHFITIHPEMFRFLDFLPSQTFLLVAITSYKQPSYATFRKRYGGVVGHYQFLSDERIKRHKRRGHRIGVGYVSSKNSLYREVNRGVEWLFSNHASAMQKLLSQLIQQNKDQEQ